MKTANEMYQYSVNNGFGKGANETYSLNHFKIIEQNLSADEEVLMTFIGLHNYESTFKHNNNHAYAITNKRILMAQQKVFGAFFQSVLLDNLNDITFQSGVIWGVITIDTIKEKFNVGANIVEAKNINQKIHDVLQSARKPVSNNTQASQKSLAEQLKDLKELLDLEILTEDEFNEQKEKLLKN